MTKQHLPLLDRFLEYLNGDRKKVERHAYYCSTRMHRVSSLEKLQDLLAKKENSCFTARQSIQFRNIPFGASPREVAKLIGNPRYKIVDHNLLDEHVVYFYKITQGGIKTKFQLHFISNTFFMASYGFDLGNKESVEEIESALLLKYMGIPFHEFDKELCISDSSGNSIILEKDFEFHVIYLCGKEEVHRKIVGAVEKSVGKKNLKLAQKRVAIQSMI